MGICTIDSLESRRLLSSSVIRNILTVVTGNGHDRVTIDMLVPGTRVKVTENGQVKTFDADALLGIRVRTNSGNDVVTLNANGLAWGIRSTVQGGLGNDAIRANVPRGARLYGEAGNDAIVGGTGRDYLSGGDGNDDLRGRSSHDTIWGDRGDDLVMGEGGNDYLVGNSGVDRILGGEHDDILRGYPDDAEMSGGTGFDDMGGFAAPGNAAKMIYAPRHKLMFLLNTASAIHVVDMTTGSRIDLHLAAERFTDMDLSPSGDYLFVADFGGESIGYGTALRPSFVHRFDLAARRWDGPKESPQIAYRIEAVDDSRFLTLESDQWVDMHLMRWGSSIALLQSRSADYYGDIEYDAGTGRILHGNGGSSSSEIHAYRVVGDELRTAESSGTYGSASSGGGTCVLAPDGSRFYFGRLQVEGLDVTLNMNTFGEPIYSASNAIALGERHYFDAHTGRSMGSLPFLSKVYAWDIPGNALYAYNPAANTIHRFEL